MLIDWLTIRVDVGIFGVDQLRELQDKQDRILRISGSGEMVWETTAWDSIRSDSHQISFRVSSNFVWIQGSPARVIGDGDNVFSSGVCSALDLAGCARSMVRFVSRHMGVILPLDVKLWHCSRVDVTQNLDLGGLPQVRQALAILRDCEGGRYRVSQQAGDTVYWSHKSRLRSGKAYAKGAHIAYQMLKRKSGETCREYTVDEIALANNLLRLELKLGSQFWRERTDKPWYEFTAEDLKAEWEGYFSRMIGGAEIMKDENIYERILEIVDRKKDGKPRETQAKAAYSLWLMIKAEGWQKAHDFSSERTWYRNIKILRKAGLSDADISSGKVVQFRQNIILARRVDTWQDLRLAA